MSTKAFPSYPSAKSSLFLPLLPLPVAPPLSPSPFPPPYCPPPHLPVPIPPSQSPPPHCHLSSHPPPSSPPPPLPAPGLCQFVGIPLPPTPLLPVIPPPSPLLAFASSSASLYKLPLPHRHL